MNTVFRNSLWITRPRFSKSTRSFYSSDIVPQAKPIEREQIERLASVLGKSKNLVVITGAGIRY